MPTCFQSGLKLCFFLLDMNPDQLVCMLGLHLCLHPLPVLDLVDTLLQWTQTNQASVCVPIMARLISLPTYPEIPSCDTGLTTRAQVWSPRSCYQLVLWHSDPQNLALPLKLEHSEGRKCVTIILLA